MFGEQFVLKESYSNFNIGDRCTVVEIVVCSCCKDAPLTLCKIIDNKQSKFVWISLGSLMKLIK